MFEATKCWSNLLHSNRRLICHTGSHRPKEEGGEGLAGSLAGAMITPSDADVAPARTHRGCLFLFICLRIYKSLTWYNDLIKRKQNTHRKGLVSSLAPTFSERHTYMRLGFGGQLFWNQSTVQNVKPRCEQEEGPLPYTHVWGVVKQTEATRSMEFR